MRSYSTSVDGATRIHFLDQDGGGEVKACATFEITLSGDSAYIFEVYVLPDERRKGRALNLLGSAIEELKKEFKTISFSCAIKEDNYASQSLFKKLHFRRSLEYKETNSSLYTLHV